MLITSTSCCVIIGAEKAQHQFHEHRPMFIIRLTFRSVALSSKEQKGATGGEWAPQNSNTSRKNQMKQRKTRYEMK